MILRLKIFDLQGREVATLVNEKLPAGKHIKTFKANNINAGIYFYKLHTGSSTISGKMILTH